MVWPTVGSRTAKEQNRTELLRRQSATAVRRTWMCPRQQAQWSGVRPNLVWHSTCALLVTSRRTRASWPRSDARWTAVQPSWSYAFTSHRASTSARAAFRPVSQTLHVVSPTVSIATHYCIPRVFLMVCFFHFFIICDLCLLNVTSAGWQVTLCDPTWHTPTLVIEYT